MSNTPIKELLKEYENCDYSNIDWVIEVALRYIDTMEDSQVRCILYTLTQYVKDRQ